MIHLKTHSHQYGLLHVRGHFKIAQDLYLRYTWYFCFQRHEWEGKKSLTLTLRSILLPDVCKATRETPSGEA